MNRSYGISIQNGDSTEYLLGKIIPPDYKKLKEGVLGSYSWCSIGIPSWGTHHTITETRHISACTAEDLFSLTEL